MVTWIRKHLKKKILTDCFKDGDRYFNSGDLLTLHENNWLSFADRVGDTFRWKGENVSTMEVAAIVNKADGVLDANVYGVQVDNTEGRAGMAQMNVSESFNLSSFADHVEKNLNGFQKPYFLRLTKEMQTTGTFKHQKEDLKKLGFDPSKSQDPVYFLNGDKYEEINEELYKSIQSGNVRF
jgi:fatty-acyl-CoA synthase